MKYRRVLLKLSGEALKGSDSIIDNAKILPIAEAIRDIWEQNVEVVIVIGAGNIWRGANAEQMGMNRNDADYMGMMGTIINSVGLQSVLEQLNVPSRVLTAFEVKAVAEPYIRRRAMRHLEKKRVVICGGGTGHPYFTTDTTAALRAAEMDVDVLLMAKNGVDGVYSANPRLDPKATHYSHLTYLDVLNKDLKVMDMTAVSLCMENKIDILVFNIDNPQNIVRACEGNIKATLINGGK